MARDQNLDDLGLTHTGTIHWNLSTGALYEHAVRRGEAELWQPRPVDRHHYPAHRALAQ